MRKSFLEWVSNPKQEKRRFRSSKACYLLDLKGNIINEFNNLLEISRHLNMGQISKQQYNSGCIIKKKYRVFTIDFYLENKIQIATLNSYSREDLKKSEMHRKQNTILCDLFPNEEFLYTTSLAKKMNKSSWAISLVLKGKTISNPYNIRYKYPELQNLDFRQRKQ